MRGIVVAVLLGGCAGPSQQQLAETSAASAPARPAEAPPASTSDKDRERLNQSFEDMDTTQRAHREASGNSKSPLPATFGKGAAAPPKKKGVAEQATLPPKKGPAQPAPAPEQAPEGTNK